MIILLNFLLFQSTHARAYRLYTDLDDTAFAAGYGSIKSMFSGADVTKSSTRTYAGFESFLFHLSTGGEPSLETGEVNICTARPNMAGFRKPKAEFEDHINGLRGVEKRVKVDRVLYGNFVNFPSFEKYGKYKYNQIKNDIARYKRENGWNQGGDTGDDDDETKGFIFIGDNGQGDVLAGKKLLEEKLVDYVFIHIVVADEPISTEGAGDGMVLFRNYEDAANKAADKGIVTPEVQGCIKADYTKDIASYSKLERLIEGI